MMVKKNLFLRGVVFKFNILFTPAYLFDPKVEMSSNKRKSYENVTGLFQMDDSGYYYYTSSRRLTSDRRKAADALD